MNVMILAAGDGTRMRPLTDSLPKPLLKVAGKTLIERLLEDLVSAGFQSFVINVARRGEMIIDHLGDGERFGSSIRYSNEGESPLETGGGIKRALPLLGEQPFLVVNADLWTDFPFQTLRYRGLQGSELAHLVMVANPAHHPVGDYDLRDGLLVTNPPGERGTFAGISVLSPEMVSSHAAANFKLRECLDSAIVAGRVSGSMYHGEWRDVGTPESFNALNQALAGGTGLT